MLTLDQIKKKNPFREIKEPQGEPQMRDPSSWDGQLCTRCHIYREHNKHQQHANICNNYFDRGGDSDETVRHQ